ncbi:MAG: hypothetical protein R3B93_11210 [Bacteroidia bacterium]
MSKYKINIDKPLPDPEVIQKYKNFDSLYDQYRVNTRFEFWRSLYRNPAYFAGMVAVFAVLFLVFDSVEDEGKLPFIQPPLSDANPEFASFMMDVDSSVIYTSESGTRLHLPALAWVNEQEKAIKGKIELKIRELKDPADMFLAGINSRYDSAESQRILSSEGMVEIQAFASGQPVFLADNKEILIEYLSYDTASRLGVYLLDTLERNWDYQGNDQVELLAMASYVPSRPEMPEILRNTDELRPKSANLAVLPQKPGKPFGVKVKNPDDYPEFRGFERIFWEYVAVENSANPWTEGLIGDNTTWGNVRVSRVPNRRGYYQLAFSRIKGGTMETKTVIASPLFEAGNLAEAEKLYQQRYQEWENAVATREKANAEKAEFERKRREAETQYKAALAEWETAIANLDSLAQMPAKCYRKFSVSRIGIFNLATAMPLPPATAKISLTDGQGEPIEHKNLRLFTVDEKVNALIPAEKDKEGNFLMRFDPQSQKVVWLSGPENHLYRLPSSALSSLKNDRETIQAFTPEEVAITGFQGIKEQLMQLQPVL